MRSSDVAAYLRTLTEPVMSPATMQSCTGRLCPSRHVIRTAPAMRPFRRPRSLSIVFRPVVLAAAAVVTAATAAAQQRPGAAPAAPVRDSLVLRQPADPTDFEQSFQHDLQKVLARFMSQQYEALAAPENVRSLARFTKSYFDELVRLGFSRDEALRIVVGQRVPLPGASR